MGLFKHFKDDGYSDGRIADLKKKNVALIKAGTDLLRELNKSGVYSACNRITGNLSTFAAILECKISDCKKS